jgi:hypothetical protein
MYIGNCAGFIDTLYWYCILLFLVIFICVEAGYLAEYMV